MKVLIGCEFSGIVRDAFRDLDIDAILCDLIPTEREGPHIQDNILDHLNDGWDKAIFFPPCTRLCNSGVRWLAERNLWKEMQEGANFFRQLLDSDIPQIAIENPIPHKYALEIIGRKYDQIIQPYQFGDGESKATCLWLKGFPKLIPTNIVQERRQKVFLEPPSKERSKNRSRTYPGIARAMASQWS